MIWILTWTVLRTLWNMAKIRIKRFCIVDEGGAKVIVNRSAKRHNLVSATAAKHGSFAAYPLVLLAPHMMSIIHATTNTAVMITVPSRRYVDVPDKVAS